MKQFPLIIQNLIWILMGFGLLYLFTQLTHDLVLGETNIPLTGQSLAALIIGFCWPRWTGILAIVVYLLAGGFGLPVFAEGASGWSVFQGSTAGFLFGFLMAASYLRSLRLRGWNQSVLGTFGAMIIGTLIILGLGVLRLTQMYGFESGLEYGFWNLWPGATVKLVLAALVSLIWVRISAGMNK